MSYCLRLAKFTLIFTVFSFLLVLTIRSLTYRNNKIGYYCDNVRAYSRKDKCVLANVLSCGFRDVNRVTLVLHMSADRFDKAQIIRQLTNWNGPVSVGIAFPHWIKFNSPQLLRIWTEIQALKTEVEDNRMSLSIHFLLTRYETCTNNDVEFIQTKALTNNMDFSAWPRTKPRFSKCTGRCLKTNGFILHSYPVNFVRNVARENSKTNYILLADMEHYFSDGFEQKMSTLAQNVITNDPKTVLVYRIFEVEQPGNHALSKNELLEMFHKGEATVFHTEHDGHKIEYLKEWFEYNTSSVPEVQCYLPYDRRSWEPQFVSSKDIPLHDETFMYPQRDNTVLRWEMCRADYKWAIVHDVFMYHPKSSGGKNEILETAREMSIKAFETKLVNFIHRMDKLYPETYMKCPQLATSPVVDFALRS